MGNWTDKTNQFDHILIFSFLSGFASLFSNALNDWPANCSVANYDSNTIFTIEIKIELNWVEFIGFNWQTLEYSTAVSTRWTFFYWKIANDVTQTIQASTQFEETWNSALGILAQRHITSWHDFEMNGALFLNLFLSWNIFRDTFHSVPQKNLSISRPIVWIFHSTKLRNF